MASVLVEDLEKMGAVPVGPAPNVERALKLITETPRINAAILDERLRGKLVFPVADELMLRHIPFVFVTGTVDDVHHYNMPVHTKLAEMVAVAKSLLSVIEANTTYEL